MATVRTYQVEQYKVQHNRPKHASHCSEDGIDGLGRWVQRTAREQRLRHLLHGECKVKAHENVICHEVDCPPAPEDRAVSQQPPRTRIVVVAVIIRVVVIAAGQKAAVVVRAVRAVVVYRRLALAVEIVIVGAPVRIGKY